MDSSSAQATWPPQPPWSNSMPLTLGALAPQGVPRSWDFFSDAASLLRNNGRSRSPELPSHVPSGFIGRAIHCAGAFGNCWSRSR